MASPTGRPAVHRADWTPERIQWFWDNLSQTPELNRHYFSRNHGEGICEALERLAPVRGPVLDYGCGTGDLLALLLERGHRGMGCDGSPDSVATVRARLGGKAGFLGAFPSGALPPEQPALVTLIEVIEHLPAPLLPDFLRRAGEPLPAGGLLFTTSPHAEELDQNLSLCPECACLFHPSQHLASITPKSIGAAAAAAGYQLLEARPTLLRRSADRSLRTRLRRAAVERLRPSSAPHLVCLLRKKGA
jgi:SAM-dependent methyltransferase